MKPETVEYIGMNGDLTRYTIKSANLYPFSASEAHGLLRQFKVGDDSNILIVVRGLQVLRGLSAVYEAPSGRGEIIGYSALVAGDGNPARKSNNEMIKLTETVYIDLEWLLNKKLLQAGDLKAQIEQLHSLMADTNE